MKKSNSLFGLVMSAAKRANELASGEQPLIQTRSKKVSSIALEEISKGKVTFQLSDKKEK